MLRLTKKTDYGLIALRYLASRQRQSDQSVSAKEVSEAYGIPLPLLAKILQKLGKNGFVSSEQGTNGGYRLSRPAALISTLEVVRAIEGPVILANCFTEHSRCGHSERCSVKRPLQRIQEEILRLLQNVTVEDMLDEEEQAHETAGANVHLVALQPLLSQQPQSSGVPIFDSVTE